MESGKCVDERGPVVGRHAAAKCELETEKENAQTDSGTGRNAALLFRSVVFCNETYQRVANPVQEHLPVVSRGCRRTSTRFVYYFPNA